MLVTDWYPADLGTHDFKGLYVYKAEKDYVFLKEKIPTCFAAAGYVGVGPAAISTATVPIPSARSGVMMSIISTAADLMQDFKTDYLTRSSAKSVFVSEVLGAAMGCVIGPLTLWLYSNAFDIRSPDGPCKAPYAVIYREIAIPGIQGDLLAVEELFSDTDDCQPSKKSLDRSIGHQDFPCDDSMLWNSMESHPEKRYLWDLLPDELNYLQHTCDRQVYLKCGFHSKR
ncbi:putative metal-nicotianamine transporter YSL6 [Citrus sinensis]|nr:putative metal-nicotianamine transporter YSL6 [Citrus sinensis]